MHPPINWRNKIKDNEISLCNTTYIFPRKRPHRRTVTDPPCKRNTCWKADYIATSNMADAVLLTRLRSGSTPLLKAYVNVLDPAAGPTCPLCKEEPQTLKHWLQRLSNLDAPTSTDPEKVLALARATFYSPRRPHQQQQ